MTYDSKEDTIKHIGRVQHLLIQIRLELEKRGLYHDRSKLEDPEKVVFDEYTPKLKNSTYGSDEYKSFLNGMGEGLKHHYANNRHHPEHFEAGINDMNLIDICEMLADWKAATERHDDGDLGKSLIIQAKRFDISPQLQMLLYNTSRDLGWL